MKYWKDFSPAEYTRRVIITVMVSVKEISIINTLDKAITKAVIAARNVFSRVLLLFPLESSKNPAPLFFELFNIIFYNKKASG